ncbi:MAG: VWA domain-containing protein [Candidatus Sericytochromatia bacterium]|nr:VWA domain-containing protein [Candidatus Sericytochromatia bacterium]
MSFFQFETPQAFILLLLIPLYFYLNRFLSKQINGLPFTSLEVIKKSPIGLKAKLYRFLLPLRLLILVLLIFSLARPQFGFEKKETKIKGIDIMLAIDTSKSMLAEDLSNKNRIETSKEVISNFIKQQKGNKIGLVVFSGKSFTLSPLTLDYDILLNQLKEVNVDTVKVDGTAIGDAIINCIYRFNYDKKQTRIIILLTDGENNSGQVEPLSAINVAISKKVKIYTIGVGKPEGAPMPFRNPDNGVTEYARDINGNILLSKINESDLITIADKTGGTYFRATDNKALQEIYVKINSLEKSEVSTITSKIYQEKMSYFLIISLILILIDFLLNKKFLNPIRI